MMRRINPECLQYYLHDHPDQQLVKYMVDGYTHGFDLGMTWFPDPRGPCKNGREVWHNPGIAMALIKEEIALEHILGPFDECPFENAVYSPINLFPKLNNRHRLIHDLSYPFHSNQSVNSCIPEENSTVHYHQIDEVIELGLALGCDLWSARIDINFAFHNQPLSYVMLPYICFSLDGKTFINSSVPFGSSSSCALWEKIAGLPQYIV